MKNNLKKWIDIGKPYKRKYAGPTENLRNIPTSKLKQLAQDHYGNPGTGFEVVPEALHDELHARGTKQGEKLISKYKKELKPREVSKEPFDPGFLPIDKADKPTYFLKHLPPTSHSGHDSLHAVVAFDGNGGQIAELVAEDQGDGTFAAHHVGVNEEHQRNGIATAMYKHLEKHSGLKAVPDDEQTEDGKELWKSMENSLEKTDITPHQKKWLEGGEEGFAVYKMHPQEFLKLTSPKNFLTTIGSQAKPHETYEQAKAQNKIDIPPHLTVNEHGHVLGHEGRHRAMAALNAGHDSMDVGLVADRSSFSPPSKFGWRWKRKLPVPSKLKAQKFDLPDDSDHEHTVDHSKIEHIEPYHGDQFTGDVKKSELAKRHQEDPQHDNMYTVYPVKAFYDMYQSFKPEQKYDMYSVPAAENPVEAIKHHLQELLGMLNYSGELPDWVEGYLNQSADMIDKIAAAIHAEIGDAQDMHMNEYLLRSEGAELNKVEQIPYGESSNPPGRDFPDPFANMPIHEQLKHSSPDVTMAALDRPEITAEHLTEAMKDPYDEVRLKALRHPLANESHVMQGLKDTSSLGVRTLAREHPRVELNSEHLHHIIDTAHKEKSGTQDRISHTLAAEGQKLEPAHIDKIFSSPDGLWETKSKLLARGHPGVTAKHLSQVLEEPDDSLKGHAINHPAATEEHVSNALAGKYGADSEVQRKAAAHHKLSDEGLMTAITHEDPYIAREAAENPNAKAHHLQAAIEKENPMVLSRAGYHPNLTDAQLHRLLTSSDESVRGAALHNENIKPEHIDTALQTPHAHSAIKHPMASHSQLMNAINNAPEDYQLAQSALKNPNITDEHIKAAIEKKRDIGSHNVEQAAMKHGLHEDPEKVSFPVGTNKLRAARDLAEQKGGSVNKKDLEAAGLHPEALGIKKLQDGKGNISAEKIQEHIDAQPKHTYGITHDEYGESANVMDPDEYESERDRARERFQGKAYENSYEASDHIDPRDYMDEDAVKEHYKKTQEKMAHPYGLNPNDFETEDEYHNAMEEAADDTDNLHEHARDNDLYYDNPEKYAPGYQEARDDAENEYANQWVDDKMDEWENENKGQDPDEAYEEALGGQRHTHEPSQVLQVNFTPDQAQKMKRAGVFNTFKNIMKATKRSGHPAKDNSIGWVRYTDNGDGAHIDEIQSDFGQTFSKQIKSQVRQAIANGQLTEEQGAEEQKKLEKEYPDSNVAKIQEILFGHHHPNDILHEAFHQHMRDKGEVGKPVQTWTPESKAPISGQRTNQALPVHMTRTYGETPRKMGYKPAKYGELSTQHNPQLKGKPTQETVVRKKEEEKQQRKLLKTMNSQRKSG